VVSPIIERERQLEMRERKLLVAPVQRADGQGPMANSAGSWVSPLFCEAQQLLGNVVADVDAGSMQMMHEQTGQNGGQLGMIGPLPAQLTGTFIGPSDLQRCEALGGGGRRPQRHLHVKLEMVTLVSGGQVG
jgi:hypothetical protein